jgi:aspartyl-tRNA(Asn)/glutamyl-tRNA(Gln) amidotransferase subunit A
VLSHSAYHSYYEKALLARNHISYELQRSFSEGVNCLVGPTSPVLPFSFIDPPSFGEMLMNDLMTVPANLAGLPALR